MLQFLVMAGNVVGRSAFAYAGGKHYPNEYTALIGITGRGRKGTSLRMNEELFSLTSGDWLHSRRLDGVQSGEGIIYQVRDDKFGVEPRAKYKKGEPREEILLEAGVHDKRLMLIEEEFSSLLKNGQRNGNTITEVLRRGWDSPLCLAQRKQEFT